MNRLSVKGGHKTAVKDQLDKEQQDAVEKHQKDGLGHAAADKFQRSAGAARRIAVVPSVETV